MLKDGRPIKIPGPHSTFQTSLNKSLKADEQSHAELFHFRTLMYRSTLIRNTSRLNPTVNTCPIETDNVRFFLETLTAEVLAKNINKKLKKI